MPNLPPGRKVRVGEVVSTKMDKTAIVKIERKILHPVFKKYIKKTKKLYVHDSENICRMGDTVQVVETRPLSKTKRWKIISVIKSVGGANDTA